MPVAGITVYLEDVVPASLNSVCMSRSWIDPRPKPATRLPTSDFATSFQVAPSFLYALPDKLTDYVWMRPYVGAGMIAYRSTLSVSAPATES